MKSLYFCLITIFITFSIVLKSQTILDYERTTFSGTYQQINGTLGPWGTNDAQNVNLPFSFFFIDSYFNQVRICTNGWIELGSSIYPLSYSYSPWCSDLFSSYEPNKTLAPWRCEMASYTYNVEYTTLGTSPNRVFVVQWRDVYSPYYSSHTINFQVRLYETTNVIEFWYGNVSGSGDYDYAAFGIEDPIGGSGHFIDGPTGSNTIGITGLNSWNNWPSVFYRFNPAPVRVIKPNGGEHFSIGYADTIKWASMVNDVKLEYSTDSGNFWNLIENSIPASPGQYLWVVPNTPSENSLVRISDAADQSVFDVSDNVFSIAEPPQISVIPDSITVTINEGDSIELPLQISNSGTGNLYYEISIENINPQSLKKLSSPEGPFSNWKDNFRRSREKRVNGADNPKPPAKLSKETLPLIISDPKGDGGSVDITEIRGLTDSDSIKLQLVFETELNVYDFGGFIGFDIDQDMNTGVMYPSGISTQTVGCEYFAELYDVPNNQIYVYDQNFYYVGYCPAQYDLHNVSFSLPLSVLGNDDGILNLAAVVGNYNWSTDWIPDQGCGIVGGNLWLNVNPLSGTINPGGSENVQVKISTEYIDGGEFYANLLISSNDPVNQIVTIPVHLTVIGQPDLAAPDSSIFGEVYVGFPATNYLNLRNKGSVNLDVSDIQFSNDVFSVEGNTAFTIPPSSTFDLPVTFNPSTSGVEAGTLSIISNDPSSPFIVNLSGEGLFPPSITVSLDSFSFELNVGDTLNTQFIIDNSNGLGELTFQISDKFIAGKVVKRNPHQVLGFNKRKGDGHKVFGFDQGSIPKSEDRKVMNDTQEKSYSENRLLDLPVIVQDNIGDGGVADIREIRGQILNNNLEVEYVFAEGVDPTNIIAELCLDIDRNPLTGGTDPYFLHDLGVDYSLVCEYYYFGPQVYILEYSTGNYSFFPCDFSGTTISYSIPLSALGDDDGDMDLLAVSVQDAYGVLDWAPDAGHATLYGEVPWLNENPLSGTIPAGGSLTIEVNANTSELIGGNFLTDIEVGSNDPAHPVTEIPFRLHLTGIPQLAVSPDSLNFGETYIGYSSPLSVSISSTGTDSLVGTLVSNDPEFILTDSVFTIPVGGIKNVEVQYHPLNTGLTSASLTINSNGGTQTISLSGTGLIAPNITTSVTSMQFVSIPGIPCTQALPSITREAVI